MFGVVNIRFFVEGEPGTKGSVRAFAVRSKTARSGFRGVVTNDSKKAKPWAKLISVAAKKAMRKQEPLQSKVCVAITFYLQRPKGHFRKNGALKPGAPRYVATKPDGDKLVRCAWDALTGVVFGDDCQIVAWSGQKLYSNDGHIGAEFRITEVA